MWRIFKWFNICVRRSYLRVESDDEEDVVFVIESDI